jgi:flagellar hook assembly protein FlgD
MVKISGSPNPFNESTHIEIDLIENGDVVLQVYDIYGRLTTELFNGRKSAGKHNFTWNASEFSKGIYFAVATVNGKKQSLKLLKN